jgi:hypothetical protein
MGLISLLTKKWSYATSMATAASECASRLVGESFLFCGVFLGADASKGVVWAIDRSAGATS